ncbi:MAG TPA: gamma carbonic anhydrase family protein [Ktedonobacterales bacterium]
MPILPYNGVWPRIASDAFIAPTAVIAGDVTIGAGASVWFGAVIRGDEAPITIGAHTNVQDNCVVHIESGLPCVIGEECSLGHGAIVHGARLGDRVLVGMHATVLSRAQVASDCIIAAGAVVAEGHAIPTGMLVLGLPGRAVRAITEGERQRVREGAEHYQRYAREYAAALAAAAAREAGR